MVQSGQKLIIIITATTTTATASAFTATTIIPTVNITTTAATIIKTIKALLEIMWISYEFISLWVNFSNYGTFSYISTVL